MVDFSKFLVNNRVLNPKMWIIGELGETTGITMATSAEETATLPIGNTEVNAADGFKKGC